ncbi:MAG: hypothetical protein WKG06_29395 [Segetibacter sp.]
MMLQNKNAIIYGAAAPLVVLLHVPLHVKALRCFSQGILSNQSEKVDAIKGVYTITNSY